MKNLFFLKKVILLSVFTLFLCNNSIFAQCGDCNVDITYSGYDAYLTSPCDDPYNFAHVWTVTSPNCGDHYANYSNNGSQCQLYMNYMDGQGTCEFRVVHCIYRTIDGTTIPDLTALICCQTFDLP